jgi:peptide deformylase
MAVRTILKFPQDEAGLRKKSQPVKRNDSELQSLIQDLKDTLATQPGAGLAAPQIGVHKRVALVRFGQDEGEMQEAFAIINPVIRQRGSLVRGFDGCLSMPGLVTWDTKRPQWLSFRIETLASHRRLPSSMLQSETARYSSVCLSAER